MWRRHRCLSDFFRLSIYALFAKTQPDKVVRWCPDDDFCVFLRPVFPASRVQQVSDLHSKFALATSTLRPLGLGEEKKKKKKERRKKKLECGPVPNVMAALPNIGGALCSTPQSLGDAQ